MPKVRPESRRIRNSVRHDRPPSPPARVARWAGPWRFDDVCRSAYVAIAIPTFHRAHHALVRSEEHTSELQSLMRISYAVFCLKKKNTKTKETHISSYIYYNKTDKRTDQ